MSRLLAVLEMVDTTFGVSAAGADTANLVSMVDRTQAAQLYAGAVGISC